MATRIQDVAAALGVSVATVSRTISGKPGVSNEVRARVLATAKELDYTVSRSASGLVTGRTLTIGVVTPYIARWYFGHTVEAIGSVLAGAGYDLLLYDIGSDESRDRFFAKMPAKKRVDALVTLLLPDEKETRVLRELGIPIATAWAARPGIASVSINDVLAAETAVRHLINLGHRSIAMIGEAVDPVPMQYVTPAERRSGYLNAMREAGIEPVPEFEQNGHYTVQGGEEAMNRILASREHPTAVFVQSDEMAFGALRAIRRHGLRVPEDISVIGIDGHELSENFGLTTLAQPLREMGAAMAELLLEQLESPVTEVPPHIEFPTRLVVRETTGPVRS